MGDKSVASVVVELGGDASGLTKTIATVKALMSGDLAGALEGAVEVARQVAEEFEKAFELVTEVIKESVRVAGDHQQAMQDLTAALARAGVSGARPAAEDFARFAHALQETTGRSEDELIAAAKVGASFGLTGETLKRTTQAANDLSSVLGGDVNSSIVKIVQGTTTGSISIGRFHLALNKAEVAARGVDAVLDALNSHFAGAAAASAQTYEGRVRGLSLAWEDAHKALGAAIVSSSTLNAVIVVAAEKVGELTRFLADHKKGIQDLIDKGWKALVTTVEGTIRTVGVLSGIFGPLANTAIQSVRFIVDAIDDGIQVALRATIDLINVVIEGLNKIPGVNISPLGENLAPILDEFIGARKSVDALAVASQAYVDGSGTAFQRAMTFITRFNNSVIDAKRKITAADSSSPAAGPGLPAPKLDTSVADLEALKKKAQETDAAFKSLGDSIGSALGQLATGTANVHKVFASTMQAVLAALRDYVIKRIEADQTTTASTVAASTAQATTEITANAATAASGAAASQAGVPIIGPALAIAAAGMMFSFVSAYLSKFASGGKVGGFGTGDQQVALVETGEIILPKRGAAMSNDTRAAAMARLGAGAGGTRVVHEHHWHIETLAVPDRSTTRRWIRDTFVPEFNAVAGLNQG